MQQNTLSSDAPDRTGFGDLAGNVLIESVRAGLGSLLGISTAAVFGVSLLSFTAGLSTGFAVTVVAVAMNAMLLSLVAIGNLRKED